MRKQPTYIVYTETFNYLSLLFKKNIPNFCKM